MREKFNDDFKDNPVLSFLDDLYTREYWIIHRVIDLSCCIELEIMPIFRTRIYKAH